MGRAAQEGKDRSGRDLLRGDIPLVVLAVLAAKGPLHGYAIAREVERSGDQSLTMREGSLYPALRLLELDGLVISRWEIQPVGPARKIYALTEKGQAEMDRREADWRGYVRAVEAVLGPLSGVGKGDPNVQPA
jgi:PadR family transcriptional regulator PadR